MMTVTLHETRDTQSAEYKFMEALLVDTFPENERRDLDKQRLNTRDNAMFHPMLIKADGKRVGLLNYWLLGDIAYVEHFATNPDLRGHGLGAAAMEAAQLSLKRIVLEVELPDTPLAQRRVGFYRRCGFALCQRPYAQPPYRKGDAPLPMLLMFLGVDDMDAAFATARAAIHKHVYGVEA